MAAIPIKKIIFHFFNGGNFKIYANNNGNTTPKSSVTLVAMEGTSISKP